MTPERRIARLTALIERMIGGNDVASRDLANVLTSEEFAYLQALWTSQLDMRDYVKDKPDAVIEYETRIRQAQFLYNRSEGYSSNPHRTSRRDKNGVRYATKFYNESQAAFERASEHLIESMQLDPSLNIWFDRAPDFGLDGDVDLSPERMPKVVTSRSLDRQGDGILHSVQRKRELKLQVLRDALAALQAPANHQNQDPHAASDLRDLARRRL